MAKTTIVTETYTDDIDGSAAAGTITFSWENTNYEIDLSKSNARAFERVLKPYIEAGRRVRGTRGKGSGRRSGAKYDLSSIRTWAGNNGYEVSARGRVASAVIEAYEAAN